MVDNNGARFFKGLLTAAIGGILLGAAFYLLIVAFVKGVL